MHRWLVLSWGVIFRGPYGGGLSLGGPSGGGFSEGVPFFGQNAQVSRASIEDLSHLHGKKEVMHRLILYKCDT